MTLKKHTKFEEKLTLICFFHQNTWKCQNWYFHRILLSKVENAWAKWGVMCNGTEEWWKIWRGLDLLFQNWHEEFDKFWLEHLKVSKIYTLMGCFWPKYIMFELKKYRGVVFHDTRSDTKFEEKFSLEQTKVSKLGLSLGPFIQSIKCISL